MPETPDWAAAIPQVGNLTALFPVGAATAPGTSGTVVAAVAGRRIVVVGASLVPDLNSGMGPSGSVFRETVEGFLSDGVGGNPLGYMAISPEAPVCYLPLVAGGARTRLATALGCTMMTAFGAGIQYIIVQVTYYLE